MTETPLPAKRRGRPPKQRTALVVGRAQLTPSVLASDGVSTISTATIEKQVRVARCVKMLMDGVPRSGITAQLSKEFGISRDAVKRYLDFASAELASEAYRSYEEVYGLIMLRLESIYRTCGRASVQITVLKMMADMASATLIRSRTHGTPESETNEVALRRALSALQNQPVTPAVANAMAIVSRTLSDLMAADELAARVAALESKRDAEDE